MNYDPPPATRGRFTAGYAGDLALPLYDVPRGREHAGTLDPADRAFIAGAYAEEVLFVDQQIGRLLDGLATRALRERTLVVVTSDHGEELFDHGSFEHGHTMYQELLHVPLVVAGPRVRRSRIAAPVSLVDVFPTVLDALGVAPPAAVAGVSLWPTRVDGQPLPARPLVADGVLLGPARRAIVRWPWKLVIETESDTRMLFDLAGDPRETAPRSAAAETASLAAELHAVVAASARGGRKSPDAKVDADTRQRLRALGYLE
jgi:arylsulfatase A-like enzyme